MRVYRHDSSSLAVVLNLITTSNYPLISLLYYKHSSYSVESGAGYCTWRVENCRWGKQWIDGWSGEWVSEVLGHAIAQAVSRGLPTSAARVRARVWSSRICGGQRGAGAGFLRVLRFSPPIFIPPNSPSSQSPGAGKIGQLTADVPSGPSLDSTPQYAKLKKEWGVNIMSVISYSLHSTFSESVK
jgi:hypothetical protein